MSDEKQGGKWDRLPKMNFSAKDLSKRMRKVEGATVKHARKFVFRRLGNMREVRRHIAIWVLMVGYIVAASALQLMWYQQAYRTTTAAEGGTYAEAVLGPLDNLNPLYARSSAEQSASALLFSRLMTYDSTGHLNYDLAQSMTLDESDKVYTVKLKPNVKWHDGQALTAQDVIFTIGLLKDPETRSTIGSEWSTIKAVAVDDRTLTFTLPSVYAAFPHALNFPVLPEHILGDVPAANLRENSFSQAPIGSGPFAFRLLQDSDTLSTREIVYMARNENYFGGVAKIERLQLDVYESREAITRALLASEVNAAVDLSATNVQQVSKTRYDIQYKPVNAGVFALFNTTSSLLSDKTIRQALQVGTDTAALRSTIGNVPALHLPFVNGQLFGDVPKAPNYNIDAASKILDDNGWKRDGSERTKDGKKLEVTVVTIKDEDLERVLEKLAGQWRALGIDVTTTVVDPSNVSDRVVEGVLRPRSFDVLLHRLDIGADPDTFVYWHSSEAIESGRNFSNYANPLADDALVSARTRVEPELRNAKYLIFARQWLADVPAIGIYQSTVQYVSSKRIHTLTPNDTLVTATDRYRNIIHWSVSEKSVFTTP